MAEKRKIKCDCGGLLVEKRAKFDDIETEAMVCEKCNFITLTKEQAKRYAELIELRKITTAKRKIIKIGNSIGITLPDQLKEFGVKIGEEVRIEAVTPKSFKLEFVG